MKKHVWAICFTALLAAFTVYLALDTFVIAKVYNGNAVEVNTSMFADTEAEEPAEAETDGTVCTDENSYGDDNVSITLTEYEEYGTTIYVADVTLSSAEYLKAAFANGTYGRNVTETTSSIAEENGAILAVNGDFYGSQEKGYVIRNGVVYRSSAKGSEVLCIFADGTIDVVNDRDYTADELVGMGV